MKFNNLKRILCSLLCLCMILGVVFTMTACGDETDGKETENSDDSDAPIDTAEKITVLRVVDAVKKGTKVTEEMFETVELNAVDVPLNAMSDMTKIVGKYTTVPLYKGEFVFAGKFSTKKPSSTEVKEITEDYLLASDYMTLGGDVTAALQKLIDENPGRTIYFPDGKYVVSKPIEVSSDPAKKVSLRLNNYAAITAAANFSGEAVIRLGADAVPVTDSTSSYIMGGIIDANGKTTAISVEGGRDMFISDVVIKNAVCGIKIVAGTAYTDVENVNVSGSGEDAVGLEILGDGNTFTSMRVTNVGTAVKASGANNTFRSIMATYTGSNNESQGFYDNSKGNNYDGCTVVDFAKGFCMETSTVSVYVNCYARWSDSSPVTTQYAFAVAGNGKLNSVIRTSVVYVGSGDTAYLKAATGGSGKVLYPVVFNKAGLSDRTYESYRLSGLEVAK